IRQWRQRYSRPIVNDLFAWLEEQEPCCPPDGPLNKAINYILNAYSALFDHGFASKSDQRFAYFRSTGNLTFSTAF
ncbi:IS66 family transposase, partial [Escherichia coli]|uniref:IS66 family transposase n=1 Tax=Escherichia coli TaxID=562 RepID=UPI0025465231